MPSTQPLIQQNTIKKQSHNLLTILRKRKLAGQKSLALLIDPDKADQESLFTLLRQTAAYPVDFFFVGGSLITNYNHAGVIAAIREHTETPVVIFPGNPLHIDTSADAILLLSLISGRNPEFLIGQHVISAPLLRKSGLEILPTGYMLIDSGVQTTVSYISGTMPIPYDKPDVAACTAMAGEMLGLQLMYLDAGSGARKPVSASMIRAVSTTVDVPVVVGGGISSGEKAYDALHAGADLIVVGNGVEQNPDLLAQLSGVIQSINQSVVQV
ncbi:MAG: geranylgeranylglyceryl/heptaprenylglyceryl phosphate synthase [Spirosoma sp.]|nr:geranylgeranylglyceryl/heptaprenylglyceryl phosphate synthase [Spirosoma sp.]